MDYLDYFGLTAEPFAHSPAPQFYYASQQHTSALERLGHTASTMKGLALLIGDIGRGKTTLARRMLDTLPDESYEAALLVIVHAGVTASWLLKRIALQLGVEDPADDKLTILSQLYQRLMEIHREGKKAVVLIDEAQMLGTRELMEEFRGLLNLEIPGQKLISFIFFGLPELESHLALDPPLAQRVTMRYHLKPLGEDDTTRYVEHRLRLAGGDEKIFDSAALHEIHRWSGGVPRVINSICDNVLLELFFAKERQAGPDKIFEVADNLSLTKTITPPSDPVYVPEAPAVEGSVGHDAIEVVTRDSGVDTPSADESVSEPIDELIESPANIAARVAGEPVRESDIADPLGFMSPEDGAEGFPIEVDAPVDQEPPSFELPPYSPITGQDEGDEAEFEIEADSLDVEIGTDDFDDEIEIEAHVEDEAHEEFEIEDEILGAEIEIEGEILGADVAIESEVEIDAEIAGAESEGAGAVPSAEVELDAEIVHVPETSQFDVAYAQEEPDNSGPLSAPARVAAGVPTPEEPLAAPLPPPPERAGVFPPAHAPLPPMALRPTSAPLPPPVSLPVPESESAIPAALEPEVTEPEVRAPEVLEPEVPKPAVSSRSTITTSSGRKIDLNEIDDLLADIKNL